MRPTPPLPLKPPAPSEANVYYKPDWDQARRRLGAWWHGEVLDRPVIQVMARRKNAPPATEWDVLWPSNLIKGAEFIVSRFAAYCEQTYFGGESFPNLWINLGPGIMAA